MSFSDILEFFWCFKCILRTEIEKNCKLPFEPHQESIKAGVFCALDRHFTKDAVTEMTPFWMKIKFADLHKIHCCWQTENSTFLCIRIVQIEVRYFLMNFQWDYFRILVNYDFGGMTKRVDVEIPWWGNCLITN